MTTLITVLKGGGRYDATWVARLAGGIRRHAPAFDRILCLTDLPVAVPGVETIPLRHAWPAWWAKMEAFRPGLSTGPTLLCDLDTVLTGPADRAERYPAFFWCKTEPDIADAIRFLGLMVEGRRWIDQASGSWRSWARRRSASPPAR